MGRNGAGPSRKEIAAAPSARSQRAADDPLARVLRLTGVECRDIADRFEFPFFHLVFRTVAPPGFPLQAFVDGGPEGFRESYDQRVGRGRDPVLRRALRSAMPFQLSDALDPRSREAQNLREHCAALGIEDGVAIPLHGPRASHGMLTLMGGQSLPRSAHMREELFRQAHWLAIFMFERTIDELASASVRLSRRQLTARQRRALTLASEGKVLAEIARALSVHPSTARYLIDRGMQKLGVDSRTEACVRLAALGDFGAGVFPSDIAGSTIHVEVRR